MKALILSLNTRTCDVNGPRFLSSLKSSTLYLNRHQSSAQSFRSSDYITCGKHVLICLNCRYFTYLIKFTIRKNHLCFLSLLPNFAFSSMNNLSTWSECVDVTINIAWNIIYSFYTLLELFIGSSPSFSHYQFLLHCLIFNIVLNICRL